MYNVCDVDACCAISDSPSMKMIKSNFGKKAKPHRQRPTALRSTMHIINIQINYVRLHTFERVIKSHWELFPDTKISS